MMKMEFNSRIDYNNLVIKSYMLDRVVKLLQAQRDKYIDAGPLYTLLDIEPQKEEQ